MENADKYEEIFVSTIGKKGRDSLKARKAELFAKVMDGGGTAGTGITATDIRALFD